MAAPDDGSRDREQVKCKVEHVVVDSGIEAEGQNDQREEKAREGVRNARNQLGPGITVKHAADRLGDTQDLAGEALDDATHQ